MTDSQFPHAPVLRRPKKVLRVRWSKRERALLYHHPDSSSNGGMLAYYFEGMKWPGDKTLAQELEARGYDLKTLRFSIERKPEP